MIIYREFKTMTKTGLDKVRNRVPEYLKNKKAGVLCHAASVASDYTHILDIWYENTDLELGTIFGPQHGLYGQTQDNMIEWESGELHPGYNVTLYSLYGKNRKPTSKMLEGLEVFVADLQDVGARPYTYIWTIKLCMEACLEKGIPVVVLDRPNPIVDIPFDGDILEPGFFTFVGGAQIPLCHRMTMGEMALFLKDEYFPELDLHVISMDNYSRDMTFTDTDLPWVLPSPNMPTEETAVVYPGQVLIEALTISEGRGTTRPFEIFGTPGLDVTSVLNILKEENLPGVYFRQHDFIPTFQKHAGVYCGGIQMHVTDRKKFLSVYTTAVVLQAFLKSESIEPTIFKNPPYEYEYDKMPFDILSGNVKLRETLQSGESLANLKNEWDNKRADFISKLKDIKLYDGDL